jgi:hypothetical protein
MIREMMRSVRHKLPTAALLAVLAVEACGGGAASHDGAVDRGDGKTDTPSDRGGASGGSDGGLVDALGGAEAADAAGAEATGAGTDAATGSDSGGDGPPAVAARGWVSLGAPSGGNVTALALAPDGTVFAGVGPLLPFRLGIGTGIFASRDLGASWQPSNSGLRSFNVQDLTVAGGLVFAATKDAMRSLDGGHTWQDALSGSEIFTTVAAASDGSLVFAVEKFPGGGLHRSEDGGTTWTGVQNPGATFDTNAVAVLGSGPGAVVLAFGDNGLSRSIDGGKTFVSVAGQTGTAFPSETLPNLLCGNGRCYLAGLNAFLVSTDAGATWTSTGDPNDFPLAIADDGTLYVSGTNGLSRSDDGGKTFTPLATPPASMNALVANSKNVYAGTTTGVFRSDDRGASWTSANGSVARGALTTESGLFFVDTSSTALSPNGDLYLAAPNVGLMRSLDDGASWSLVKVGYVPSSCVVTEASGVMCVGSEGSSGAYLRTKDHGVTWQTWSVPAFTDQFGSSLGGLSARGSTVYVAGKTPDAQLLRLARSDDGGLTFQALPSSPEAGVATQVLANGHVLANTQYETYRSQDMGATWTKLAQAVTLPVTQDVAGVLYRGYGGGVQRSTDEGNTWSSIDDNSTLLLALDISGPVWFDAVGRMYYAPQPPTSTTGTFGSWPLLVSTDLGMHWATFGAQLAHPVISTVVLDKGRRQLAATNGGVYRLE